MSDHEMKKLRLKVKHGIKDDLDARVSRIRANLDHNGLIMQMQPWNIGAEEAYNRALEAYEAVLGEVEVLHGTRVQAQEL